VRAPALAFAAALAAGPAPADVETAVAACRAIAEPTARLACYDAAAAGAGARFSGRLSGLTEPFDIAAPTLLRFASDDAVLVLYVLDAAGSVVQNLNQAGAGEGRFLIERPGRYRLQVNASGGWRVWLEPG
jgi:hypothetical protein